VFTVEEMTFIFDAVANFAVRAPEELIAVFDRLSDSIAAKIEEDLKAQGYSLQCIDEYVVS